MTSFLPSAPSWAVPLAVAAAVAGCDGGDPGTPNVPPAVSIQSPANGAVFAEGAEIRFEGSASDQEDGEITGSALAWRSDSDGAIGTTGTVTTSELSAGSHVVTLTATDADDASGNASITIEVRATVEAVERIAVSRTRPSGSAHIATMGVDGSDVRPLTEGRGLGPERSPAWSPNGERIAFSAAPAGTPAGCPMKAIFIVRSDGSQLDQLSTPVGECGQDLDPTWAPGEEFVAFCRTGDDVTQLAVLTPSGEEAGSVTLFGDSVGATATRPWAGCDPHWSPGGRYVLFDDREPDTGFRVVVVWDLSNGGFFTFAALPDSANTAMGRWSPDGSSLAFASDDGGDWNIYVLDLASNELMQLTTDPFDDVSPTWSPDGTRIAFRSDRSGEGSRLYLLNLDGTGLEGITDSSDGAAEHREPDWLAVPPASVVAAAASIVSAPRRVLRRDVQRPMVRGYR